MKKLDFYFKVNGTPVKYALSCDKDNGNIILKQDPSSKYIITELSWPEFKKEISSIYSIINAKVIVTNGDNKIYYDCNILAGDSDAIPSIVEMKKNFITKMIREDVYVFSESSEFYPIISIDEMIDEVRQFLELEITA